jgi:hypothetical protein
VTDLRPEKMNGSETAEESRSVRFLRPYRSGFFPTLSCFHPSELTVADNDACALTNGVDGDLEGEVVGHKNHGLSLLRVRF